MSSDTQIEHVRAEDHGRRIAVLVHAVDFDAVEGISREADDPVTGLPDEPDHRC